MSKWVVDIHGDIEGDYEIIEKYEEPKIGHWKLIQRGKFVDIGCSECGHIRVKSFAYNYNAKDVYNSFQYEEFMKTSHLNFCENCGVKMLSTNSESEE